MRILVLGGTFFLSRQITVHALDMGHDVTVAARGASGAVPAGARHVVVDRSDPDGLAPLADSTFDAVVDVARKPSWVRTALDVLGERAGHWTFVSSCSVYADESTAFDRADAERKAAAPDTADESDQELYGHLKVSCENAVLDRLVDRAFVCRPGLIVGEGDPTGRFSYWPRRLADGGEILAPGSPDDLVQLVDVRDLAAWLVSAAQGGLTGVLDAVCQPLRRADFLAAVSRGVGVRPDLTWVPQDFLAAQEVEPWIGPRSVPLWLPLPQYAGFMTRDVTASIEAGLQIRPLEETARDTLGWLRETPDAAMTGLTREEESAVLAAWHSRDAGT